VHATCFAQPTLQRPYPDEIEDEVRPSRLGRGLLHERSHDGEDGDDVGRQERRRVRLVVARAAHAATADCRRGRGLAAAARHRAVSPPLQRFKVLARQGSNRNDDVTIPTWPLSEAMPRPVSKEVHHTHLECAPPAQCPSSALPLEWGAVACDGAAGGGATPPPVPLQRCPLPTGSTHIA